MMTTTKNSKRKNQPNGVDINQFPKLGAAIDETVTPGLLNGGGGRQEPYPYGHAALRGSGPSGRDTGSFWWYSVSCCRRRRPRNRRKRLPARPAKATSATVSAARQSIPTSGLSKSTYLAIDRALSLPFCFPIKQKGSHFRGHAANCTSDAFHRNIFAIL